MTTSGPVALGINSAINLMHRDQWDEAREAIVPLIAAFHEVGDLPLVVVATHSLAEVALELYQRPARSRALAEEALTLARRVESTARPVGNSAC